MKKIEIEIPDGKRAEWVNGVLTLVDDKPKDVTERIKTFEDACAELGDKHPLVTQYRLISGAYKGEEKTDDLIVYLKLRIIVAALNEGWEPKFTKSELRWYPSFILYTGKELLSMIGKAGWKDDKHIISTDGYLRDYAAFVCKGSSYTSQSTVANISSHLCFKSKELAEYCSKQFISLWIDFYLIKK